MKLLKKPLKAFGLIVLCLLFAGSMVAKVYAAPGAVGPWTASGNVMPAVKGYPAYATYNNYVYVLGGYAGGPQNNVYYAHLNTDGSVGTWAISGTLPVGVNEAGAVAYNGYIYLLGGYTNTHTSDVYMAPLNSDGTVGSWAAATSTPHQLISMGVATFNGYVYVTGGNDGTADLDTVYFAHLNSDGTVGSWTTANNLPAGLTSPSTVAYNNNLYVTGGIDTGNATDLVRIAHINSDGSLGSWAVSSNHMPQITSIHSAVVYHGYIFVIGGYDGGPTNFVSSAAINSDGTIGSWSASPNSFPQTFYGAAGVQNNGFVYIIGGYRDTAFSSAATYAQLEGYPAPSLSPITATVTTGSKVVVDVLANVTGNPDPSTLRIVSGPSHGTAFDPPETITYIPTAGYTGTDSLVYEVCSLSDSGTCSQATLNFNVLAGVKAPATGFGVSETSPWQTLAEYSMFALALLGAGMVLRKSAKQ
jgi:N-acetylneuraminic acid mutarotase